MGSGVVAEWEFGPTQRPSPKAQKRAPLLQFLTQRPTQGPLSDPLMAVAKARAKGKVKEIRKDTKEKGPRYRMHGLVCKWLLTSDVSGFPSEAPNGNLQ